MKPIIGITVEVREDGCYHMPPVYADAVIQAGGLPILIPLVPEENLEILCEQLDGIIVTGGEDIDPSYYHEEQHISLGRTTPKLDKMEFALVGKMLELDKPYLGICRGLHMLNIVTGGTLYQSIHSERSASVMQHRQIEERTKRTHSVSVDKNSRIYEFLQEELFQVNSFHHQAVNKVGENLKVVAKATDGIVECVESTAHSFVFGFQWHPEEFAVIGDKPSKRIFEAYIEAATKRKNK